MPLASASAAAGYLIAFDGTWNHAAKGSVIYQFYRDRYAGTAKAYYPGVGAACGSLAFVVGGLLGVGATQITSRALGDLARFYREPAHCDVPLDLVGYSRGAFQVLRLLHRIRSTGLRVRAESFCVMRPRIRFVGLVSPVGQMGAVFTRLNPGWPKTLPPGVKYAVQLLAADPEHRFFMETSLDISAAATAASPPRSAHGHAAIGWAGDVVNQLTEHAREAGVPVCVSAGTTG